MLPNTFNAKAKLNYFFQFTDSSLNKINSDKKTGRKM